MIQAWEWTWNWCTYFWNLDKILILIPQEWTGSKASDRKEPVRTSYSGRAVSAVWFRWERLPFSCRCRQGSPRHSRTQSDYNFVFWFAWSESATFCFRQELSKCKTVIVRAFNAAIGVPKVRVILSSHLIITIYFLGLLSGWQRKSWRQYNKKWIQISSGCKLISFSWWEVCKRNDSFCLICRCI
jgi:hypothetical protein